MTLWLKAYVVYNIRIIDLLLNELKLIVKNRRIKGYKIMSKERLLSVLNESEWEEVKIILIMEE